MLTNDFKLSFSGRDTLRPLGIWFRPLQILYVTLNIINIVVTMLGATWLHGRN